MKSPDYSRRRQQVLKRVRKAGHHGILVSGVTNVRYLTGFTGDSSWLLLGSAHEILISDSRYSTQIANECGDLETHIRDARHRMVDAAAGVLRKAGLNSIAVEGEHLTLSTFTDLSEAVKWIDLHSTSGVVEESREVKDAWELEQIREAIGYAERGIAVTRASLTAEQSEREIAHNLEHTMRGFGATGCSFEPIVGVGPTAALPHAHAGCLRVSESPVLLIDWGARTTSGYISDLTRVFITGKITARIRKVYDTVLLAQKRAIEAIRPGAECVAVDRIARDIIADAGFGRYFGHGLGHGIGLDVHEGTRFSPISAQTLKPGMVVTVEPGIYLPGKIGVRIEDDVLVTKTGYEILSSVPKEFDDAIVDFLA